MADRLELADRHPRRVGRLEHLVDLLGLEMLGRTADDIEDLVRLLERCGVVEAVKRAVESFGWIVGHAESLPGSVSTSEVESAGVMAPQPKHEAAETAGFASSLVLIAAGAGLLCESFGAALLALGVALFLSHKLD